MSIAVWPGSEPIATPVCISLSTLHIAKYLRRGLLSTAERILWHCFLICIYRSIGFASACPVWKLQEQARKQTGSATSKSMPPICHRYREAASSVQSPSETQLLSKKRWWDHLAQYIAAWRTYLQQEIFPAASALALLYLTVMSLGVMMTAYLKWRGMTEARLSIFRGLGAVTGVASTYSFPWLHGRLGKPAGISFHEFLDRYGIWLVLWMPLTHLDPAMRDCVAVHSWHPECVLLAYSDHSIRQGRW